MERAEAEAIYEQGKDVVVAVLLRMDEQIQRLEKRVAQQDERIAQLERRLGRNSRNSSQPPSADPPSSPPRRGKDPSGRKQGAQPGHEGKGRPLLPAWAVDEFVDHWPTGCECGHAFSQAELVADGDPARHQVEELPPITVTVTEHRCQRVRCPDCGRRSRGELPAGVADSAFGPRYHAAVAVLSVRNRISRRDVVELCEQLFGSRISTGTVDAILARVGDALAEPYAGLLNSVRAASHVNMDETGWRLKGAQRALWGAFTDRHAVLAVAPDRSEDHACELLGDTTATVTSDRWWAYNHLRLGARIRSQSTIDRMISWVEDEQPDLRRAEAPDGTVSVLFSDIEDSTRLTERLGDQRWLELLEAHDAIVREHVRTHGGYEVKSQGDGFMLAFPSAREAVACAIDIQRALAARAASGELPLQVRMGIHTGEAIHRDGDFYGRSVILAARIADRAHGGEILVSSLVKELIEPSGIPFREADEVELKGLDGRHRIFRVAWAAPAESMTNGHRRIPHLAHELRVS